MVVQRLQSADDPRVDIAAVLAQDPLPSGFAHPAWWTPSPRLLGINRLAAADAPLSQRPWASLTVLARTLTIAVYTIVKSKRLSDFLDAVSDEPLSAWTKLKSFFTVWRWRK